MKSLLDYKDDKCWLMHGDCLDRMKEIPDGSVDVILSDIPYGISFSKWDVTHENNNSALLGSSPAQIEKSVFSTRGKPINGWSYLDRERTRQFQDFCSKWLKECYRVAKPCTPLVTFTGRQNQHRFTIAAEDCGFIFKDSIIWDKVNAPFRAQSVSKVINRRGGVLDSSFNTFRLGNLAPRAEPIVWCFKPYPIGTTITDFFIKDGLGCFNSIKHRGNIITHSSRVVNKLHETQKPIGLMVDILTMFSIEGHTVLDMFCGSGTTGVACMNLNRKFIGIEIDDKYFNIGKERILQAQLDNRINTLGNIA